MVGEESRREKNRREKRVFSFRVFFVSFCKKNQNSIPFDQKTRIESHRRPPPPPSFPLSSPSHTAMATLSSLSRGMRAASAAAPANSRRPAAARRAGVRRCTVVASASDAPAPSSSPADAPPSRVSGGVIGAGGVGTIGSTLRAALPSDYAKAKIKVR